jgi:hypothetical protein
MIYRTCEPILSPECIIEKCLAIVKERPRNPDGKADADHQIDQIGDDCGIHDSLLLLSSFDRASF